jgi:hypothetical protein
LKFLLFIFFIANITISFALPPEEYEPYSIRPDITSIIEAKDHSLGKEWADLKMAHLEMVSMILGVYPDREIYFLARDAELLYDTAKTLLKGTEDSKRIHLLNVSRTSSENQSHEFREYLKQEGITDDLIEMNKIMFIDTGFEGTIPSRIKKNIDDGLHDRVGGHFISSNSPEEYASSATFWSHVDSQAPGLDPFSLRQMVLSFETKIPHYTGSAINYRKWEGADKYQAISIAGVKNSDGIVSKESALKYMEDLLFFLNSDQAKVIYQSRKKIWQKLWELGRDGVSKSEELEKYLLQIMSDYKIIEPRIGEAIVRDFLEAQELNSIFSEKVTISLEGLGLNPRSQIEVFNNRETISIARPEWKDVLENPSDVIPSLIRQGKTELLTDLIRTVEDKNFSKIFYSELGNANDENAEKIINSLIDLGDEKKMVYLIDHSLLKLVL